MRYEWPILIITCNQLSNREIIVINFVHVLTHSKATAMPMGRPMATCPTCTLSFRTATPPEACLSGRRTATRRTSHRERREMHDRRHPDTEQCGSTHVIIKHTRDPAAMQIEKLIRRAPSRRHPLALPSRPPLSHPSPPNFRASQHLHVESRLHARRAPRAHTDATLS